MGKMWKRIEEPDVFLEMCGDDVPIQSVFVTSEGRSFRTRVTWNRKLGVLANDNEWPISTLRELQEHHRDRVEHFIGPQEVDEQQFLQQDFSS